nr:MerR family DNA-binding protein [Oceanococcus sp. HetDA_MAG_MS8]
MSALRFYEAQGLLVASRRSAGNYRMYDPDAVDRARFIHHAKQLGFSLDDIRDLLRVQDSDSRRDVRALAQKHVARIESHIKSLQSIHSVLANAVRACDGEGSVEGCPVIESIQDLPDDYSEVAADG